MPEPKRAPKAASSAETMLHHVGASEARLVRRRREGPPNLWRSLGLIGFVGWSVALPILVGVAVGTWIDRRWPSRVSWTLMLLFAGTAIGCINAWKRIRQEEEDR